MKYFLYVQNNKIVAKGNFKNITEGVLNFEVNEDVFNNSEQYIYSENNIILDPDYEAKQEIKKNVKRIEEIKDELSALDCKSIRAIRANETDKILEYEIKAQNLRDEMRAINAKL